MRGLLSIGMIIAGILTLILSILTGLGPYVADWTIVAVHAPWRTQVRFAGIRCQINGDLLSSTVALRNDELFAQEFSVDFYLTTEYENLGSSRTLCSHKATAPPGESTTVTCQADIGNDNLPQIMTAQVSARDTERAASLDYTPVYLNFCRIPPDSPGRVLGVMAVMIAAAVALIFGGIWLRRVPGRASAEESDV